MAYPDIKTYHENRREHRLAPLAQRPNFLGQDALDTRWMEEKLSANIKKKAKIYEIEVAIPGFAKEDIEVKVEDDILTVWAKRRVEEEESFEYVIKEFGYDMMERKFKLAKGIGHEQIQAKCENGILRLTFFDVPANEEVWYKNVEVQ